MAAKFDLGSARGAQYVGARIARTEDHRLLTGDGRFVDDIQLPHMLEAAFVRSPVAHAHVTRIDTEAAKAVPGVVGVFTAEDMKKAGVTPMVTPGPQPGMTDNRRPVLADGKVRHVGEAIAVVVATTRYIAEDACELVEVDFDRLPAVVDPEQAVLESSPILHDGDTTNRLTILRESHGDPDEAFANAAHVFEKRFVHGRVAGIPIECRGVIAEYSRGTRNFTIYSATQCPHLVRTMASWCLNVREADIRVIAPDVGGGFGIKAHPFPEEVVLPAVARLVGRPVKWIEDRYEHLAASVHSKEIVMDLSLAVDEDGNFTGMRGEYLANAGAYACFPQSGLVDAMCAATLLPSLYKVDNVSYSISATYTNKCMTGTYRGVGWGAGHTAREALIDDAARALGRDPLELRLQNCIPDEPYENVVGMKYDGGSYQESMRRAKEAVGYDDFRKRQEKLRQQGRYIGIGFSPFVEPAGIGTAGAVAIGQKQQVTYDWGSVAVDPDGSVVVRTGMHSHGQGHETTFAQLAADTLGAKLDDVRIVFGDTETVPYGTGTFASRSAVVAGGMILRAGADVREKLMKVASHKFEVAADDIELFDGRVQVKGAPDTGCTLAELAEYVYFGIGSRALDNDFDLALTSTRSYDPPESYSNGTVAVLVEVDPSTGEISVEKTVAVEDCGVMLNPTVVAGQVAGGVAQGLGGALYEDFVYDEAGNFQSGTLMDYLLASAVEIGDIDVHHIETPSTVTEGGIKGMGEAGTIAAPAAAINAITDALAPFNIQLDRTPVTPAQLCALIAANED